jgi:hypothetical protein
MKTMMALASGVRGRGEEGEAFDQLKKLEGPGAPTRITPDDPLQGQLGRLDSRRDDHDGEPCGDGRLPPDGDGLAMTHYCMLGTSLT